MYYFYFDASALVKWCTEEVGSDKIEHLFANVPMERLMCLSVGAAEVFSICVRKKNDGRIKLIDFNHAVALLKRVIIDSTSDFETLPARDSVIWRALSLMDIHAINSVDAIVLRSALDTATELRRVGKELVLVASDQKLLRAARNEGLLGFDPQTESQKVLEPWVAAP